MGLGRLTDEVFEAVIFDLDGTLIDSTPAVMRAWTTWAREFGLAVMDLPRHHGTPSASVVRAVMPEDLHGHGMRRITELELADLHDVVVLPGAVEALASLADAKNAIATSCTVPLAEARMGAAQLVPPSVLVTADDVVHGKPHPEPFLAGRATARRRSPTMPRGRGCPQGTGSGAGRRLLHAGRCHDNTTRSARCRRDCERPIRGQIRDKSHGHPRKAGR